MPRPEISIVSPSYNMLPYLTLCHRSIVDQNVNLEHIVIDAASTDGTQEWLSANHSIVWTSEPDRGMYDAINKGLALASGEVLAYLNCDEQYLPGALKVVREFFANNPDIDVLFGDVVVVDNAGEYLCSRQTLIPRIKHTVICQLNTLTAATFFRRSVVERGLIFDDTFRNVGDAEWMARLVEADLRMAHLPTWLASFTETGKNLGLGPAYHAEKARLASLYPRWWRAVRPVWTTHHRFRRLRGRHYSPQALSYSIYLEDHESRQLFLVNDPTFRWVSRR